MAGKPRIHNTGAPCAWVALMTASYLAALSFITFPQIDLIVSSLFAASDGSGFPIARLAALRFLNELVPILAGLVALFILLSLLIVLLKKRPFLGLNRRRIWFLTLSFGLGPGLVANTLLKDNWGRARPRDITQFGGTLDFSPPVLISDQCATNCSFISGDASLAFTFLALALIIPKRRILPIGAALAFGTIVGAARLVQGAHFLSDVVFAGLFMALIVTSLYMLIIEKRSPLPRVAWFENLRRLKNTANSGQPRLTLRRALWLFFRAKPDDLHVGQAPENHPNP